MTPIKVLLVVEVPLIGNIFTAVLKDEPNMQVAGCVATPQDALRTLQEREVNVALISVGLPEQGALTLTRKIMDAAPGVRVLVLGLMQEDQQDTLRYIEAGAAGYILKDSSLHEFVETIRLAHRGEAKVSPRVAGAMMERLSNLARMFAAYENKVNENVRLTSREREVLEFISEGLTNQEIAARLVLEVGTVKNHVHNILEKLNVSNRDEAASYLAFIKR